MVKEMQWKGSGKAVNWSRQGSEMAMERQWKGSERPRKGSEAEQWKGSGEAVERPMKGSEAEQWKGSDVVLTTPRAFSQTRRPGPGRTHLRPSWVVQHVAIGIATERSATTRLREGPTVPEEPVLVQVDDLHWSQNTR